MTLAERTLLGAWQYARDNTRHIGRLCRRGRATEEQWRAAREAKDLAWRAYLAERTRREGGA